MWSDQIWSDLVARNDTDKTNSHKGLKVKLDYIPTTYSEMVLSSMVKDNCLLHHVLNLQGWLLEHIYEDKLL